MVRPDIELSVGMTAEDAVNKANELHDEIEAIFKSSAGKDLSPQFQSLLVKLSELYDKSTKVSNQITEIGTKPTPELQKVKSELFILDANLQQAETDAKNLRTQLDNFRGVKFERNPEYEKVGNTIDALRDRLADAKAQANSFAEGVRQGNADAARSYLKHRTEVHRLEKDLGILEKYQELLEKRNDDVRPTKAYAGLTKQVEQAEQKVKDLTKQIGEQKKAEEELYKTGKARTAMNNNLDFGDNVEQQKNLNNEMSMTLRQLDMMQGKAGAPLEAINGWQVLMDVVNNGPQAVVRLADTIAATLPPQLQAIYVLAKAAFGLLTQFTKDLTKLYKDLASKGIKVATAALKQFGKVAAKAVGATVLKPVQKLASAFADLGKKATDSNVSMKQIGRMVLQYGFGARSLYRLVNKLRKALFEGFETLANFYQPFNASMSEIMTSLEYLKNSFAAAFAPIIQVVSPALSLFINQVANAVQMVGQFIAALTGKEFVMAMPVYQDYAENSKTGAAAAKETAAAEKAAAKAEKQRAKELKEIERTIAGFDDVEILKKPKDSSTTTDPITMPDSPTLTSIATTFKTAPIADGLKEFADLIKKAWLQADFYDIGQLMNKQLGKVLKAFNDNVPNIEKMAQRVGSSIGSFLAGFLSIQSTFVELGKAIGNGINIVFSALDAALDSFIHYKGFENLGNAIFNTIYSALSTIKWGTIFKVFSNLGAGIATTLNNVIGRREFWQQIFRTLSNMMTAVVLSFYKFVTKLKWGEIGTAIGTGINTGIATYPLKLIANTAAKFINGIFSTLGNAARTIHWGDLGKEIADSIMLFFRTVTWKKNGQDLGAFVQGIFDTLAEIVNGTGFSEIAQDIINFIIGFFSRFKVRENLTTFANFLNGLLDALKTALAPVNWSEVSQNIINEILNFFNNFHWRDAIDILFNLIEGLTTILYNLATNSDVKKTGEEIINKIKEKLESPEWQETTAKLWELFKFWMSKKVAELVAKAGFLYTVAKAVIGGLADYIVQAAGDTIGNPEWLKKNIVDPFIDKLKENFGIQGEGDAKETFTIGGFIADGLTNGFGSNIPFTGAWMKKKVSSFAINGLLDAFGIKNNESKETRPIGEATINGLTNGVKSKTPDFSKQTSSVNSIAQKNLSAGNWSGIGSKTMIGGMSSGINSGKGGLYTLAGTVNSGVFSKMSAGNWNSIGSTTMVGSIRSGMNSQNSNIQRTASTINTGIYNNMKAGNWASIGSTTMVGGVSGGMNRQHSNIARTASIINSSIYNNMSSGNWTGIGRTYVSSANTGMSNQSSNIQRTASTINSGIYRNMSSGNWSGIGRDIVSSTKSGLSNNDYLVLNQAQSLQYDMYSKLNNGNYYDIGSGITSSIKNGIDYNDYSVLSQAFSLAQDIYSRISGDSGWGWSLSWYNLGTNIMSGIYNAFSDDYNLTSLKNAAWDLAVGLYNSACDALGISSPSKVFRDKVGAMIPAGIAVGIDKNMGVATDSMDELTNSLVDSATGIKIPPIAMGEIIPYDIDNQEEETNTLKGLLESIQALQQNTVGRDELEELLTKVARDYFDVKLQIGDETVARHANNGNRLLNTRYNLA